ncbi:DNA-processing protein DprA, partial [Microgenomates group bacterium]|nr:DNA-processing protein DprA [Microgenomates group bacterium]
LLYRGGWEEDLFKKAVAVVGSRRITKYGRMVTEMMVRGLTEAGYTIVSGFMYGVDTQAHKTCLENKGRTVAVLGCGLDCLTPAENDGLYTKILESGGLVVSEFEPKQEAKLWTFPYRNRIVAGLSQLILVIEAGENSGSLVTARWAFQQKKKVLAVPGMITASLSKGTNWLIRNGAILVTSVNDILEELGGIRPLKEKRKGRILPIMNMSGEEREVVELLKMEEMDADELGRKLNKDAATVGRLLSELCLKGLMEENNGRFMVGF